MMTLNNPAQAQHMHAMSKDSRRTHTRHTCRLKTVTSSSPSRWRLQQQSHKLTNNKALLKSASPLLSIHKSTRVAMAFIAVVSGGCALSTLLLNGCVYVSEA